jgi:hypothetical protein
MKFDKFLFYPHSQKNIIRLRVVVLTTQHNVLFRTKI